MVGRRTSVGATVVAVLLATAGCGANKPPPGADRGTTQTPASSEVAGTTTPSASVLPAPGTVLQHLDGRGRLNVVTDGYGFTFIQSFRPWLNGEVTEQSVITAYDAGGTRLARIGSGPFTGECGAADVVVGGRRTLLTELITGHPAQGINPALFSLEVDAWDARTGTQLWKNEVVHPQRSSIGCTAFDGALQGFAATYDGKWGLYSAAFANVEVHEVIDLATGLSHSAPQATGVIGNYLIHSLTGAGQEKTDLLDPVDGKIVGSVKRGFGNAMNPAMSPFFKSSKAGLTPDGTKIVTLEQPAEGAVVGAGLPGLRKIWSAPAPDDSYRILGDQAGLVLVDHFEGQPGERLMIAYADDTGKERWRSPGGEVCGMTQRELLLAVNGQLATLDMATGQQLAYRDGGGCPMMLPGGISVAEEPGGLMVTQELRR